MGSVKGEADAVFGSLSRILEPGKGLVPLEAEDA